VGRTHGVRIVTPRFVEALDNAIIKWRAIEAGELADLGGENCDLCAAVRESQRFDKPATFDNCATCGGCPVAEATKDTGCQGSPWTEWSRAQSKLGHSLSSSKAHLRKATTPELKALAHAELVFLESLVPK